jgi:NAD(P)-dependent dehydrogenase (short-subunit alcohol dehydrogenase family)
VDSLLNKAVFVGGGAGEVGEGVVRALLQAGARVGVASRSEARLVELRARIGDGLAARLTTFVGEPGTEAGAARLPVELVARLGGIDAAVASLGGWWQGGRLVDVALAQWNQILADNLTAHFATARVLLPLVTARSGTYVLLNGAAAEQPVPSAGPISVAAAAQTMLARVLAAEACPGTRVVSVVIATPVVTRSRPRGRAGWLSADEIGAYVAALIAGGDAVRNGEARRLDRAEFGRRGRRILVSG